MNTIVNKALCFHQYIYCKSNVCIYTRLHSVSIENNTLKHINRYFNLITLPLSFKIVYPAKVKVDVWNIEFREIVIE